MLPVLSVSQIWYTFFQTAPSVGRDDLPGPVDSARCLGEAGVSRNRGREREEGW